jgi:hypothetical protein
MADKDRLIDKTKGNPVDRVAARVTSRSKDKWDFKPPPSKNGHEVTWDTPPKLRPVPNDARRDPGFVDFTGTKKGQLTVIGLFDHTVNNKGRPKKHIPKAWWAVHCTCGKYEIRSTKALRNKDNKNDRCMVCRRLAQMKRHRDYLDGNPQKEEWEY